MGRLVSPSRGSAWGLALHARTVQRLDGGGEVTWRSRPCPTPFLACSARCPTLAGPVPMLHDSAALQDAEGKETGRGVLSYSVAMRKSAGRASDALAGTRRKR